MIYLTGDCHADYHRFNTMNFPEQKTMTKDDYVIVCGDFGLWKDTKEQKHDFDWLDMKPFTTLWVDGNHENYDWLKTFPVEEWHGGKVQKIRDSVIHLMRGQVYDICGKKFFTFGGASSHDISGGILERDDQEFKKKKTIAHILSQPYRINHESWWKEELPTEEEMQEGRDNLAKHGNMVDFIVTHCAGTSAQNLIARKMRAEYEPDILTDYLEEISSYVAYEQWICGHYHINASLPDFNLVVMYEQIEPIQNVD